MAVIIRFELADQVWPGGVGEVRGLVPAVAAADGDAGPRLRRDVDGSAFAQADRSSPSAAGVTRAGSGGCRCLAAGHGRTAIAAVAV
jgi:hypothetical protein